MRKNLFSVSQQVTSEALPIEKLVDTMCHMEELLFDIHEVLVAIHNDTSELRPAIDRGIKQAQEGIAEAEVVREDIRKLTAAMGGADLGLFEKERP